MMKRLQGLFDSGLTRRLLVPLTVLSLALAACGGGSGESDPGATAAETDDGGTSGDATGDDDGDSDEGEATGGESIVLKYADVEPPSSVKAQVVQDFAAQVEEATEGRVTFEFFWSDALVPAAEVPGAIASGVAEAGYYVPAYDPSYIPLLSVADLPGLLIDARTGAQAVFDLFQDFEPVRAALAEKDLIPLFSAIHPGDGYIGSHDPIESLDNIQGMQVRTLAGAWADLFQEAGAETVAIPGSELYTALERGTVDAAVTWPVGWRDLKWYEPISHMAPVGIGTLTAGHVVMSKDAFESLSPADQEAVLAAAEAANESMIASYGDSLESALSDMRADGVTIADDVPTGMGEQLQKIAVDLRERWAEEMDASGQPGTETLEELSNLIEQYS